MKEKCYNCGCHGNNMIPIYEFNDRELILKEYICQDCHEKSKK